MPNDANQNVFLISQRLIKKGNLIDLRSLIESGADVNVRSRNGATLLMCAAIEGDLPIIEFLLAHGADVSATDKAGVSALACAALEGQWRAVRALLRSGAPVNVRPGGLTLLEFTQQGRGCDKTKRHIELLKQAGAE
jgi:ankyrin repeat protein